MMGGRVSIFQALKNPRFVGFKWLSLRSGWTWKSWWFPSSEKYPFKDGVFSWTCRETSRGVSITTRFLFTIFALLVESTHLKNIFIKLDHFPQVGVNIKNIWNHHPDLLSKGPILANCFCKVPFSCARTSSSLKRFGWNVSDGVRLNPFLLDLSN